MFIEIYRVEKTNLFDGKAIHYNGFTSATWDDEFPFAATEATGCFVEIGDDNYERACDEFELCQQYGRYFRTAEELIEYEDSAKHGFNYLHMDHVTQDTPCGTYWFELDD